MSESRLPDHDARETIRTALDRNLLVEASAGSGKTHSLADRMAAGIAAGRYQIDGMAAVTFTRKAAAELRIRFQGALESLLAESADPVAQGRIRDALARIERMFTGTIHAFCAHLLRERPVEAGLAPGFTELDEVGAARARRRHWRDFIARRRAESPEQFDRFLETGLRPAALDRAFERVCLFEEVEFPPGTAECPDLVAGWAAFDRFFDRLNALAPAQIPFDITCKTLPKVRQTRWRRHHARRDRPSELAELMALWSGKIDFTQSAWHPDPKQKKAITDQARDIIETFQVETVHPFLDEWRRFVYRRAIELLADARAFARDARYAEQTLNYEDLLQCAARLLRENAGVRAALRRKFRWLFVDEFQDTDPIQAEVIVLLASVEPAGPSPAALDWRRARLEPGRLFVVGDPKQSIYRFRRADIEIYNRVRDLILDGGGGLVRLTTSFRSRPELCDWLNEAFEDAFPPEPSAQQAMFSPIDALPVRKSGGRREGPCVCTLPIPVEIDRRDVAQAEAERIAAFIRGELDSGRRGPQEFLLLTRKTRDLAVYASALEALQIPVEVSGAGAFGDSTDVATLAELLRVLADPNDGVSLVGVLRGPFFGVSDQALFEYRRAGGTLRVWGRQPAEDGAGGEAGESDAGGLTRDHPAVAAIEVLRDLYRATRKLPLPVAVEHVLEDTGFLALTAATTPGGAAAGDLLQVVERARQVMEQGGALIDLVDSLGSDVEGRDVDSRPLEPGRQDVVRVMNLHKAKGLEANVVFLADPCGGVRTRVDLRIDRSGDRALGYTRIVRESENDSRSGPAEILGEPGDWPVHEAAEIEFLRAEETRLRYVAATRARDLLVVGQWLGNDRWTKRAWESLDAHLLEAPELVIPLEAAGPKPEGADLSARARAAWQESLAERRVTARAPSFAARSVTGGEDAGAGAPGGPAPEAESTPRSRGAAAGADWGDLIHGLLEFAMRHASATRDDLERAALWLTWDKPELRSVMAEAAETSARVMASDVWQRARAAEECHSEVPFARVTRLADGTPEVLHGVVDLVFSTASGWLIVDYKTDQVFEGGPEAVVRRHAAQVGQYVEVWRDLGAGGAAVTGAVHIVRTGETRDL